MSAILGNRAHHSGAFTLIEMMAVMLLLALIAGVALPAFGRGSGADAENDALEIAAGIETARRAALTDRVPFRLVVDLREAAWWLEREARDNPEAVAEAAPGELPRWADDDDLPLTAPTSGTRTFENVPGLIGQGNVLRETVHFVGARTVDGFVEDGSIQILFRPDGIADPTTLTLEAENGTRFHLVVESIDEIVGVNREEG